MHHLFFNHWAILVAAVAQWVLGAIWFSPVLFGKPWKAMVYPRSEPQKNTMVAGMVVSFISPHSLSARALVIAPDDLLTVHNSSREALAMAIDGRPSGEIPPGAMVRVRFADDVAMLMQMEGSSFYRRLRDKFGALSR